MKSPEFQPNRAIKNAARTIVLAGGLATAALGCAHSPSVSSNCENSVNTVTPRPYSIDLQEFEVGPCIIMPVKAGDILLGDFSLGPNGTTLNEFVQDTKAQKDSSIEDDPNIVQTYGSGIDNPNRAYLTIVVADGLAYIDGWKGLIVENLPLDSQIPYVNLTKNAQERSGRQTDINDWNGKELTHDSRFDKKNPNYDSPNRISI